MRSDIRENAKVKSAAVKYYLTRVDSCLNFFGKSFGDKISNKEKDKFLAHLVNKLEDWQIKQADYAVKIYSFFISSPFNKQSNNKPSGNEVSWENITDEFRNILRLQHKLIPGCLNFD